MSLVRVGCCHVEVFATGRSLVQRSPTECGVSECDREPSIMKRPWTTPGGCSMEEKKIKLNFSQNYRREVTDSKEITKRAQMRILKYFLNMQVCRQLMSETREKNSKM